MENSLILIAEDEAEIAEIVGVYLENAGMRVVKASNGELALQHAQQLKPDLVLLDIKMPKKDGMAVLRELRRSSNVPVIMMTALAEDIDKISTLRLGADDYVVKPFNPLEIVERVKAVLRRVSGASEREFAVRIGALKIDKNANAVFVCVDDKEIHVPMTHTEYLIVAHMSLSPKRAYSRAELVDACLPEGEALERTVDSHVSNARRKLNAAGAKGYLETVRSVGYRLEPLL